MYSLLGDWDARFDWSRIAPDLATINSREVIIAGVRNFTLAAQHFVNVSEEVIKAIEEN